MPAPPNPPPVALPRPPALRLRERSFDAASPAVMAIVNRTRDSFWSGNRHADLDSALRGVLCSGGGTRAIRLAGETPVRAALTAGLEPFGRADGGFVMHNHFRLLLAGAPG